MWVAVDCFGRGGWEDMGEGFEADGGKGIEGGRSSSDGLREEDLLDGETCSCS